MTTCRSIGGAIRLRRADRRRRRRQHGPRRARHGSQPETFWASAQHLTSELQAPPMSGEGTNLGASTLVRGQAQEAPVVLGAARGSPGPRASRLGSGGIARARNRDALRAFPNGARSADERRCLVLMSSPSPSLFACLSDTDVRSPSRNSSRGSGSIDRASSFQR